MAKILNLDEVETNLDRAIVLGGKTYNMRPMSVEDYIAQMKDMATAEKEKDPAQLFELMVASVCRAFPTLKEPVARKMNLAQLQKLTIFIQAVTEDETETGK